MKPSSTPFFSISTPCFNSSKTIERTIQSVLTQDFMDYEYIIIDGGSTDGTVDILKQYEPKFNGRMKWFSEPDRGLYDAFNKGIMKSKGVYCWNVNSDDWIEPDALKTLYSFISGNDWDRLPVISGIMNFVSLDGDVISTNIPSKSRLAEAFKKDCIGVPHPATLVPKEMYERLGAFDINYKIIGDADWFHRVYASGESFEVVNAVISNMSDGGASNEFCYKKSLKDRIYFLRKYYSNPFTIVLHWARWTKSFVIQKWMHERTSNDS